MTDKKKLTVLTTIIFLLTITSIGHTSIVAHWMFDEAGGSTTAYDSAGSYDGTLLGSASFVASGVAGGAISLTESSGDLVDMGNVLGFSYSDMSVSAWIQTTTTESDTFILSKHHATYVKGYLLGVNANGGYGSTSKAWFYNSDQTDTELISTTTVNDGNWHNIVAVYDRDGNKELYVDGSPAEAYNASHPMNTNSGHFLIGGVTAKDGTLIPTYTGLIDDVQIYDQSLTSNQVQFLFENPGQTATVPIPGALWLLGSGLLGLMAIRRRGNV
jgi:hypothetical protein